MVRENATKEHEEQHKPTQQRSKGPQQLTASFERVPAENPDKALVARGVYCGAGLGQSCFAMYEAMLVGHRPLHWPERDRTERRSRDTARRDTGASGLGLSDSSRGRLYGWAGDVPVSGWD